MIEALAVSPGRAAIERDPTNPPGTCTPTSLEQIGSEDAPIRNVLASPPRPITNPLAIEEAESSFTGVEFVSDEFVREPVRSSAALYSLGGDFGFFRANATDPAHEAGHEIKLINVSGLNEPLAVQISRFAHNTTFEQAFVNGISGFNWLTQIRMGWTTACGLPTTVRSATSGNRRRKSSSWEKATVPSSRSPEPGLFGVFARDEMTRSGGPEAMMPPDRPLS